MTKVPANLQAKLKKADADVRYYVAQLDKRNAALNRQILAMEADKVDRNNRIKALEQQLKEKKVDVRYNIDLGERLQRARERTGVVDMDAMTPEQIKAQIKSLLPTVIGMLRDEGYTVTAPG